MADPVLTTLCSICHVSAPKYKCPRCRLQTCSLECSKKHKSWSECNGQRDATAYIAPSKLRTPAGVDHDYNFLHNIERSVERSEKILVNERGLIQADELRPVTMQEVKWKTGRDGRKRKVVVTRVLREAKGRVFEKNLAQKLRKVNVRIICVPVGMKRMRENCTTLNRKTGRVNWQVEWLALDETGVVEHKGLGAQRVLRKVMDDVPLYQAYHELLGEQGKEAGKPAVSGLNGGAAARGQKGKAHQTQSSSDSRWTADMDGLQDALTGMWLSPAEVDTEEDKKRKEEFTFYLGSPAVRGDLPTKITRLEDGVCLRDVLTDTQVLEFPTIYVMAQGTNVPQGFVLGDKEPAMAEGQQQQQGTKRKNGVTDGQGRGGSVKKRRPGRGQDREEGEVGSDGDDDGGVGGVGLEAGEVVGEESFGEDEEMAEAADTSSSEEESD